MAAMALIKRSEYHDSVSLMLVARELSGIPGVTDAAIVMATEPNKAILEEAGLLTPEARAATPNDLVIAVTGEDEGLENALAEAEKLLGKKRGDVQEATYSPKTIRGAVKVNPDTNIAVISVPGRYAAEEAWEALRLGLHVLLFSDNVSIADEQALKKYANQAGLLLMGPGAGTAIINGVALGFANVIPRGPVGIASAAGTGLQEVSTLLAKYGTGITQGLGTGGRDLKEEVGGIMMLDCLRALQEDPETQVIVLVSKSPAPPVIHKVMAQVAHSDKTTVVCFIGGDVEPVEAIPNAIPARTLQEASILAAQAAGVELPNLDKILADEDRSIEIRAVGLRAILKPGQHYLRGLFSGGTLCYEAQVVLRNLMAEPVLSNAPLETAYQLTDSLHSVGHTVVDLGEEEFTVGRPHPMIDNDLRIRRLYQEVKDPEVAVVVLDVVLGYGAHPNPAAELGPAVSKAHISAREDDREVVIIASVTGTEADPQGLNRQVVTLEDAGVNVCQSNAAAARLAAKVLSNQ